MESDHDASRTIRFCDAIDVREIPNKDAEVQLMPNGSRKNPSQQANVTCGPKIFKTKQNIIIGIVLICVIAGTVGRIVLSEEDEYLVTFNETCEHGSSQCDRNKDLHCINKKCHCDYSKKYWDMTTQICVSRQNYSQICLHNDSCMATLICSSHSRLCICDQRQYYNSILSRCVNRASLDESCLPSMNSTCLLSLSCDSGKCVCPKGKRWLPSKKICVTSG
ncbi:unnamed protein product [Adineta ricciae]|uniref:EB domain-containing protein n=1 Tax=Adineta ricciae TaxID=249248 RepID=A0A814FQQ8_ADIRI|nr:unnamed protein product [Adineta ricciae]